MLSIVIPTKNGVETLPEVFDALDRQEIDLPRELIVVDSGSTDGTVELARRRADTCLTVPPAQFNHGLTRNLGVETARGELVVMLVQDAVPASEHLLRHLTAPLLIERDVAGTFARQVPRGDASAIAKHYLARWVAAAPRGHTSQLDEATFARLEPAERLTRCAFDNVCSCLRRDVWCSVPFREVPIAEDLAWAKEVLLSGHRLSYVPDAVVVHSHDRSARHELARTRLVHRQLFELFGLRTIPTLAALARAVAVTTALNIRLEFPNPRQLARGLSLGIAWPLGQYLGGRDGASRPHASTSGAGLT